MGTSANLVQAIFITLNIVGFGYLAYKFISSKSSSIKIFGYGMALLAFVEFCVLGVNMMWTIPVLDFKSLQYLFYLYAILVLFATSAASLKPRTRYYINIFLAFAAILVTGLFFAERTLNNATAYTINYYLSFDNPATLNIFSLTVALSLGMAALVVAQYFKDRSLKLALELGYLIVTISLVISLIVFNDSIRLISSIAQLSSLLAMSLYINKNPAEFQKLKR